ncbi:MAG: polyprenyl synthetase family protein [Candidatus Hydrothermarchaeota archaeon]
MDEINVLSILEEKSKKVDPVILSCFEGREEPTNLYKASRHLIEAGGKRIRPSLTILSCLALGGNEEEALPVAAAFELIHTFTLIHDDIMDDDDFRRGLPTIHKKWDVPIAILSGDTLFALAFELISSSGLDSQISKEILNLLARTAVIICEGQTMDLEFEKRWDVKEEEYLEMVEKKTASLLSASAMAGSIVAKGTEEQVNQVANYGKYLGIAFQIKDDLLGIVGERSELGKPVGSDIKKGKKNLIILHALENSEGEDREFLLNRLGKDFPNDELNKIIRILEKTKSIEYAENKAKNLINRAKKCINTLPKSEPQEILLKLADFVVERKF